MPPPTVPSLAAVRELKLEVARMKDRLARLERKPAPSRIIPSSTGGGSGILAIVISCAYDNVSGACYVTCSRVTSLPWGYDPDPPDEDKFEGVWGGVDPLLIADYPVVLLPIESPPADTSVQWVAIPIISVDRDQIHPPALECLTEFVEPCSGDIPADTCT